MAHHSRSKTNLLLKEDIEMRTPTPRPLESVSNHRFPAIKGAFARPTSTEKKTIGKEWKNGRKRQPDRVNSPESCENFPTKVDSHYSLIAEEMRPTRRPKGKLEKIKSPVPKLPKTMTFDSDVGTHRQNRLKGPSRERPSQTLRPKSRSHSRTQRAGAGGMSLKKKNQLKSKRNLPRTQRLNGPAAESELEDEAQMCPSFTNISNMRTPSVLGSVEDEPCRLTKTNSNHRVRYEYQPASIAPWNQQDVFQSVSSTRNDSRLDKGPNDTEFWNDLYDCED